MASLVDLGGHPVGIMETPQTQAASTILMETLASIVTFYAAFSALSASTTSDTFLRKWGVKRNVGLDVANKSVSALFAVMASMSGVYILTTFGGSYYSDRVVTYAMPVAMGYFLYDAIAMFEVYKSCEDGGRRTFKSYLSSQPLMIAHHLLLSLFFIPLMINRRSHYPGDPMLACALFMEASTPFVSLRAILHNLGMRHSLTYALNGLLMVVVFLSCRILIYPWFYYVHGASKGQTMIEAVISTPPRCALWMIVALLPQLYWFRIMLSGAIKVVKEKFFDNANVDTKNE